MPNLQGTSKAQSQATGVGTITGGPVVNARATSLSVSKGQGNLSHYSPGGSGTMSVTIISATLTGP